MEDNEIVYDDPGSVKDIRKKFGVRTNPEFAQPRGPILRYIDITFSYLLYQCLYISTSLFKNKLSLDMLRST